MVETLTVIAKALVEYPDAVHIDVADGEDEIVLSLTVAQSDMGKVIGKQGKIARAIRTVVKAAGSRENKKITVKILDPAGEA